MYSIQISQGKDWNGTGVAAFVAEVLKVSKQHQDEGRALVFAVILYSCSDAELRKAINDHEYWSALNEASGSYMTVFVINTPLSNPQSPFQGRGHGNEPLASEALSVLRDEFQTSSLAVPCILFFQIEQGNVIDGLAIPLTANTVEAAYREVRGFIDAATVSLTDLKAENGGNAQGIFNLVRHGVSAKANATKISSLVKKAQSAFALAKLLGRVSGLG